MPRVHLLPIALLLLTSPAAAGPLGAARLNALRALEPQRAAASRAALLGRRSELGLGAADDFVPRAVFTDEDGRTVTRLRQTHLGQRVWAGEAIVHVEADGRLATLTEGVRTGVALQGAPRLTPERARDIALRSLAPRGGLAAPPQVEIVAFPTRFTGGIATRIDPSSGRPVFDREMSVLARPSSGPYVWAYEVRTLLYNARDGHREMTYVVDGDSGAILRKWNALQAATATVGTGASYYRGTVPLSTVRDADGTYALVASDRGTLPQPFAADQGITQLGMTTYYGTYDLDLLGAGFLPYEKHATDAWGNGVALPIAWDDNAYHFIWDVLPDGTLVQQGTLTPSGETSAVDAHFGLCQTWDFYRAVFGREGIDGRGTSTLAVVHTVMGDSTPLYDNAYWSPSVFGMFFGRGLYPLLEDGMTSLTELDITGHELTHGVTEHTASLIYAGESGAINEGTSDFLGKMVQAWVDHGGSQGGTVPDFPVTGDPDADLRAWVVGAASRPAGGLRFMYKPSLDGWSLDAWFDGNEALDVHFNSGIFNRATFFLSQGVSADEASVTSSVYLPGGMAGIGNDRAARIWFKALSEYLAADADYAAAREASLRAARDLFGEGSPEEAAVMNAWAAVNVGSAAGEGPRVRVTVPVTNPPGTFLESFAVPDGILSKVQILPTRARVKIRVDVANTDDHALSWSPVMHGAGWQVGQIADDGTWTTPSWSWYADLLDFTATSHADPRQFARGQVLLMEIDADTDLAVDAVDLGEVAMNWGLPKAQHQPAAIGGGYSVDDWDLAFWTQAFQNGYPAP